MSSSTVAVPDGAASARRGGINLPILALAIGAFGIGVTEFAPMGLLPLIAQDLRVSVPVAGMLVTAYAVGVMLGAPVMTLTTSHWQRKRLLIAMMGIFTIGNLMSALADSYEMLLVARLVTSLNHGAFFGVGSIVAASVVAPHRRAGAVAAMFMGLTIANVVGVPLAAWVGELLGWRTAFAGVTVLGVATMIALALALPNVGRGGGVDARAELKALTRPEVLVALLVTMLQSGAMFAGFTYIAPILRDATHATPAFVSAMLVLYGLGLTLGNWAGGRSADKSIQRTLVVGLVSLVAIMLVLAVAMHWAWAIAPTIFLWGVATFWMVPPLQLRVMEAAKDAPNLASATNIGAFNMGNALGAAVGGGVIALGLGYPMVAVSGAALAGLALVVVLIAARMRGA